MWNSSYMLERLIEQKKAITVCNTGFKPPTELQAQQWILADIVKLLKVFEEATRKISDDYSAAISRENGIMAMKRGMLRSRYGYIEQQLL